MTTAELLIELYSEEIPWLVQKPLAEKLRELLIQSLRQELRLEDEESFGKSYVFSTPRRVAAGLEGVPMRRAAWREQRKGPRVTATEQAVEGFLRANNIDSLDRCKTIETKRGSFWVAEVDHPPEATEQSLARLVPKLLSQLRQTLPVSMRFADQEFRWIRPLRHVLVVFRGRKVEGKVDLGGGTTMAFTDETRGHAFACRRAIKVLSIKGYRQELKKNWVIADAEERVQRLKKQLAERKEKSHWLVLGNEERCSQENAALVEYPTLLQGTFDHKFLSLPNFLREAVLYGHQKIYSTDRNVFLAVCNNPTKKYHSAIVKGYERVVHARLADAQFLYQKDCQISLEEHSQKLNSIAFHPQLGTIADKVERVQQLVKPICKNISEEAWCSRAIALMRADLATETVREFPHLQGKIGASLCEDDEDLRYVIEEQYNYSVENHPLLSSYVFLFDRIDSLTALWLAGEKPTGSGDPFALRRQAIPILNFPNVHDMEIPLRPLFEQAIALTQKQFSALQTSNVLEEILEFLLTRLRVQIEILSHWRTDCVDAILSSSSARDVEDGNIYSLRRKVEFLDHALREGNPFVEVFHRLDSLLPEAWKQKLDVAAVRESLLQQQEEKDLYALVTCGEYAYPLSEEEKSLEHFHERLVELSRLKPYMDAFFDNVLVMHKQQSLRENRLNLLHFFYRHFLSIADFRKIHHKDMQKKGQAHGQAYG